MNKNPANGTQSAAIGLSLLQQMQKNIEISTLFQLRDVLIKRHSLNSSEV